MALTTPSSAKEVSDRATQDVFLALASASAKPSLQNSWLQALIVAYSNRIFDFYEQLDAETLEALPDTAVEFLERWAAIWGIQRIAGSTATGNTVASGTAGSTIPSGAVLAAGGGEKYTVKTTATIVNTSTAVPATQLTRSGAVATCDLTPTEHGLASNVKVDMSGATQTEYNVSEADITVISATAFTYAVTGTPASPATGSPVASYDSVQITVESQDFGVDLDQILDAELTFESPLAGVEDLTQVDFDEIGGGADQEEDEALRSRLLDRIQNPVAHFNVAEITALAKTVPGVTRVFVEENTLATVATIGACQVYFMRDNDSNPIPSASEATALKSVLNTIRPANMASADLGVDPPTGVSTAFTFSTITTSSGSLTATMKTAIENNLKQFYAERTEVGVDVDEDAFRAAIYNTVDTTNGETILTFTLSTPTSDITIAAGEIGTLGNITFP